MSCRLQGFDPLDRPYQTPGVEAGEAGALMVLSPFRVYHRPAVRVD